ncbi:MAG: nickel-binding protein [Chitinophagaceae bacterium]
MDVHIVPGVKAKDVAEAHRQDLLHQEENQCKCMTYWIDEARESIFCLIEAPDKESVITMHNKAHGLIPNKIIEVSSNLVESFLGRIYDPSHAVTTDDGLKVFADPSFRFLLVTKTNDPVLLQQQSGKENTYELLRLFKESIRSNIIKHGGKEAEQHGAGFIITFTTASRALAFARDIQQELKESRFEPLGIRMAINAGEPVESSSKLFGDTIKLAQQLCSVTGHLQLAIASAAKELLPQDQFTGNGKETLILSFPDEELLKGLFAQLEAHWQEPDFDAEDYCKAMTMSKSQLYRKTIALTGLSPNSLLKDFRLERAKELLKKKRFNIAQVTFETGFSSPSYFTKCFKKKYGLLPMAYIDLLD